MLIETGENLTPYLSRSVRVGYQARGQGKNGLRGRQDLDLLLNDWGVHHLHLETRLDSDGFAKRTRSLLFAVFHWDDAYLIDIVPHGSWTQQRVMEIVLEEWPDAGILQEVKGVLPSTTQLGAEERKALRENGLNSALEVGGKVYMAGAGFTSAGTSIRATIRAQHIRRDIRSFLQKHHADPAWLARILTDAGHSAPVQLDLKFCFLDVGYGVMEQNSRILFRLR